MYPLLNIFGPFSTLFAHHIVTIGINFRIPLAARGARRQSSTPRAVFGIYHYSTVVAPTSHIKIEIVPTSLDHRYSVGNYIPNCRGVPHHISHGSVPSWRQRTLVTRCGEDTTLCL